MKTILTLLFSLLIATGFAQNNCENISLKTEEEAKNANSCILASADYILSLPLSGNSQEYFNRRKTIITWMGVTPEFTFTINGKMTQICENDDQVLLFGVYTTCMAKAAIELKKDFDREAIKLFVAYITNENNKVKQTSKVKKLIKDFNAGKIDAYIN